MPRSPVLPQPRWSLRPFGTAWDRLARHGGDGLAAGLAFGALLSVSPLLLVVLAAAGALLGDGPARVEALGVVQDALGARPAALVDGWLLEVTTWSTTATVVGITLFLFGASRLALLVDASFRVVFEVAPAPALALGASLGAFLRLQLTSLAVTAAAGGLLLASIVLRAALPAVLAGSGESLLAELGRRALSSAFLCSALALAYRALPPRRLLRREVLEGAVITTLLLEAGLFVLRRAFDALALGAAYGAAGALVGTLLALYVAAQLFLLGAERTAELERLRSAARPLETTPKNRQIDAVSRPTALARARTALARLLRREGLLGAHGTGPRPLREVPPMSTSHEPSEERPLRDELGALLDAANGLVARHLQLARLELQDEARWIGRRLALILALSPLVLVGFLFLCGLATAQLAVLTGWPLAVGLVGGFDLLLGATGIAIAANQLGRRELLAPAIEELERSSRLVLPGDAGRA